MAGDAYDRFMGLYSRPLAENLADWLTVSAGQRVLDVGCGPGALTEQLVARAGAEHVAAVDASEAFVGACRSRLPGIDVRHGFAEALPFDDDTFDVAAASLVVHFMKDPRAGIMEMLRVTRPGGRVAATVWDLAGRRAPMWPVWDALAQVAPQVSDEGHVPGGAEGELVELFESAGVLDVEGVDLEVTVTHPSFEEWWTPYLDKVGPVGEALAALDASDLERVRGHCLLRLGEGPFDLTAVAFAVRGRA